MLLADALSRLSPIPGRTVDIEETIHVIHCSDAKLQEIKEQTLQDKTMCMLATRVMEGWPEEARDLPKEIRNFAENPFLSKTAFS